MTLQDIDNLSKLLDEFSGEMMKGKKLDTILKAKKIVDKQLEVEN